MTDHPAHGPFIQAFTVSPFLGEMFATAIH